MLDVYMNKSQK